MEPQIEMGTIGWADEDSHFDLGTDENDGHTLVRVTLYRGKPRNIELKDDTAQGHQILCHLNSLCGMRIPPKGTRVYVMFGKGMETVPGGGVIVAAIEPNPGDQLALDRTVIDYGEETHLVIRAKSVSIQDYSNRFISVGEPRAGGDAGLWFQAADGTGGAIKEGAVAWWVSDSGDAVTMLQMTTSAVQCTKKSGGYWTVDTDGFLAFGTSASLRASAVYLGRLPTVANTLVWGVSGPAAVATPSVFVSPV